MDGGSCNLFHNIFKKINKLLLQKLSWFFPRIGCQKDRLLKLTLKYKYWTFYLINSVVDLFAPSFK